MSRLLAGRYELVDKIGEGGMAVVYRAKDRLLNRFVAIKILRPEYTRDEQFIESFKRESQAAARLQHPNIVTVYDVGKSGNINYIVMELVEGRPLSDIIEEQAPLDSKAVIEIGKQIASALSLAHKNQIIHRDVKPHNILITTDGVAKLTDFGIAKAVSSSSALAETNKVIGSVHYFSPEQARGSYVDERSDIYSLGIVMYEMLTGRVPFDGDNPVEVALKHINEEIIPPSKIVSGIQPKLEKVVLKATDKFQTNRYKTADEMLEEFANIEFVNNFMNIKAMDSVNASNRTNTPIDDKELQGLERGRSTSAGKKATGSGKVSKLGASSSGKDGGKDNKKTPIIILASILGLLLLAAIVMRISGFLGGNTDEVKVPDLLHMTYEEAENEVSKLGLSIVKGEDVSSDDIAEGLVAQQMPVEGSNVKKGKTVTVRLSSGPGEIEVPELINMTYEEAEEALRNVGLGIEKGESIYSTSIEPDRVAKQTPAAKNSAKPGENVVVNLSKGEESITVEVPNMIGMMYSTRDEIEQYLQSYGLKLGDVSEMESAMEKGSIVDQNPMGGSSVDKNTYVNLVIAKELEKISVPSLTGMTINEAIFICEDRGLVVELGEYVEDPTGVGVPGTVINQSVAPGQEVPQGTSIVIDIIKETVEPEPEPEPEPDPEPTDDIISEDDEEVIEDTPEDEIEESAEDTEG